MLKWIAFSLRVVTALAAKKRMTRQARMTPISKLDRRDYWFDFYLSESLVSVGRAKVTMIIAPKHINIENSWNRVSFSFSQKYARRADMKGLRLQIV